MCLITRQIKPIITKEDMIVFKILRPNGCSFCEGFLWEKGKLEVRELEIERVTADQCGVWGDPQTIYYKLNNKHIDRKLTSVSVGLHAMLKKYKIEKFDDTIIVKFLIPKGSRIFKDATGLVVSNQMMML